MTGRFTIVVLGAILRPLAGAAENLDTGAHKLIEAALGIFAILVKPVNSRIS